VNDKISHSGTIESIVDGCVKVRILQTSACAACKVASHCNAAESKVKIVDVMDVTDTSSLKVGDEVIVSASRHVANRALLLGFGFPFLILVGVMVMVLWLTSNEGIAAISGLIALAPYYGVLFLFRNKIRQRLSFSLET
jgi:sigma-E factor negative regulatory protein RseC